MSDTNNVRKQTKRRNRQTVVCTNCRKRKSKCSKGKPCSTCIRFSDQDSCTYLTDLQISNRSDTDDHILINASLMTNHLEPFSIVNRSRHQESVSSESPKQQSVINSHLSHLELGTHPVVNFIPNGCYIETKRSAVTLYSLFTDIAIEHRDPYLASLIRFRSIAVKKTMDKIKDKTVKRSLNPDLPNSFQPLSTFDADDKENDNPDDIQSKSSFRHHQRLFEKFAKYRKDSVLSWTNDEFLSNILLPDRDLFMNEIIPIVRAHILHMIPFIDVDILSNEASTLYENVEKSKKINIKKFDHMVYSIILILTLLVQLSLKFQKTSLTLFKPIVDLDTTHYPAIVSHFLFQMKVLRKCTVLQLQCLMLLRFYHWCAPEDGDGAEAQHNQVLMGTIISSAKEIGVSWKCFTDEEFFFKIADGTRPSLDKMEPDDYRDIYKSLWSVLLFWDRKMCLINGQECFIGKTFDISFGDINVLPSWHMKMMYLDSILLKINDSLNDHPSQIDIGELELELEKLSVEFSNIKDLDSNMKYQFRNSLDFEFEWMLDLIKLCVLHAKMISYENSLNFVKYHESIQSLWDLIVRIAQNCFVYFYDTNRLNLDPFTRFYTNRIVEIVANKLCVLVPTFILRFSRMKTITYSSRKLVCNFLFCICSMYFNEFSTDYYRCFKKMFTAKISYKILDRPEDKDPWEIILNFLTAELNNDLKHFEPNAKKIETNLRELIPLVGKLSEYYLNNTGVKDKCDYVERWDSNIYPIGRFDKNFALNLHEDVLVQFLNDRYSEEFNLFASFYNNTSINISDNVDRSISFKSNKKKEIISTSIEGDFLVPYTSQSFTSSSVSPMSGNHILLLGYMGDGAQEFEINDNSVSNVGDDQYGNLTLLDDIFDPLDFVSYFQ